MSILQPDVLAHPLAISHSMNRSLETPLQRQRHVQNSLGTCDKEAEVGTLRGRKRSIQDGEGDRRRVVGREQLSKKNDATYVKRKYVKVPK